MCLLSRAYSCAKPKQDHNVVQKELLATSRASDVDLVATRDGATGLETELSVTQGGWPGSRLSLLRSVKGPRSKRLLV